MAAQVDFLIGLGQTRADLFDDALVDQDVAGRFVLPVDASVGELLHGSVHHELADDIGEECRVRLARNAMTIARTKQTSDV